MASISSLGIGSGLDLNGLLNQLNEAERSKLEPIEAQIETQQVKISAYGELKGALSGFQGQVEALEDPSLFKSLSADVSGEAVGAAAGEEASPGRYEVSVEGLASAGSLATQRVDSLDTVLTEDAATLNLSFADAELDVPVDIAAGSTLEGVRDAVNADTESAVTASIVNDGEGYRLALMSKETGEQASITGADFATMAADATLGDATITQGGQDAALKVNGIDITSPTNQVEDAIQGVTLDLKQAGDSTVTVERDTRAVREAVQGFVDGYNTLKGSIGELTAFDAETGAAGDLLGDSAVRGIESRLRGALSGSVDGGGELSMLSDIGISLELDGSLSLDSARLDEVIAGDQDALGDFFAGGEGDDGLAGQLGSTLGQLLGDSGALEGSINSAESSVERLGERYQGMERSIDQTLERYRAQFGQLDGMIAEMNQTSDYLTQQFASLDAQLGRD